MRKNLKKNRPNAKKTTSRKAKPSGIVRAMKLNVKKGDTAKLLSGKDKGKQGEVLRAMPKIGKIIVDGLNIAKRSIRSSARGQSGRIVERPMPIDASNVAIVSGAKKAVKAEKVEKVEAVKVEKTDKKEASEKKDA